VDPTALVELLFQRRVVEVREELAVGPRVAVIAEEAVQQGQQGGVLVLVEPGAGDEPRHVLRQREGDRELHALGAVAFAGIRRVRGPWHQCDGVVVAAVRDPLPIQPAGEIGVEVRVVVVHLRVLVLRIELDDRHPRLPPVAGRVGAVRIEVLPEDVLGGVGLPRPGPAGDEGVPERERVAVGVVVLHAVVDGGRLGRRPPSRRRRRGVRGRRRPRESSVRS